MTEVELLLRIADRLDVISVQLVLIVAVMGIIAGLLAFKK